MAVALKSGMAQGEKIPLLSWKAHGCSSETWLLHFMGKSPVGFSYSEMERDRNIKKFPAKQNFGRGKKNTTNICFGLIKASLLILFLKIYDISKTLK